MPAMFPVERGRCVGVRMRFPVPQRPLRIEIQRGRSLLRHWERPATDRQRIDVGRRSSRLPGRRLSPADAYALVWQRRGFGAARRASSLGRRRYLFRSDRLLDWPARGCLETADTAALRCRSRRRTPWDVAGIIAGVSSALLPQKPRAPACRGRTESANPKLEGPVTAGLAPSEGSHASCLVSTPDLWRSENPLGTPGSLTSSEGTLKR